MFYFHPVSDRHPHLPAYSQCPNCGTELQQQWRYCPGCGQENEERVVPFRVLVRDFFSDFLTFDSRFFRTIPPFLFKPGVVTRDYLQGKRVRYVAPMRILLFGCLLLFAVAGRMVAHYDWSDNINMGDSGVKLEITGSDSISLETDDDTLQTTFDELPDTLKALQAKQAKAAEKESASGDNAGNNPAREFARGFRDGALGADTDPAASAAGDSTAGALPDSTAALAVVDSTDDTSGEGSSNLLSWMNDVGEQIPALADSMTAQAIADSLAPDAGFLKHKIAVQMVKVYQSKGQGMIGFAVSNGTISVFLAVLLMALFMKLLFWRPQRRYVEHVVFSVHGHAVLVYLTLLLLLNYSATDQWFQEAYLILMPYYALSIRRVYGQGWVRSILKMLVVGFFYSAVLLPILTLLAIGLSFLFF